MRLAPRSRMVRVPGYPCATVLLGLTYTQFLTTASERIKVSFATVASLYPHWSIIFIPFRAGGFARRGPRALSSTWPPMYPTIAHATIRSIPVVHRWLHHVPGKPPWPRIKKQISWR
ncbi:hypothetical protein B0J13DRAFT_212021 [Dactylonectria estremocensis]|uniref:Uncharacterized protein n=1 Tax=Dactylonectria estremocensis TaxID=1079267 RepID=A0A9P9F4Z8_9HYPO|nr:hypothetical protein B0J13DRAFT_212021 [Dactylonectria estremocensis]